MTSFTSIIFTLTTFVACKGELEESITATVGCQSVLSSQSINEGSTSVNTPVDAFIAKGSASAFATRE